MLIGEKNTKETKKQTNSFDYSFVSTTARVAIYDDALSAPRIIEIQPAKTAEYIENISTTVYTEAKKIGSKIPYTAIREVSENFIHAKFEEVVVSILDNGKTIRFADQGPGISQKDKAQLPGFTSAIEPMKKYIRGVGSGLPIVKEYLTITNGQILIDDNLDCGAVVSLIQKAEEKDGYLNREKTTLETTLDKTFFKSPDKKNTYIEEYVMPQLSDREKTFITYLAHQSSLGITDLVRLTGSPQSSTYVTLNKLEKKRIVQCDGNKKRSLTKFGVWVSKSL